mmetsp:Transcript_23153/g.53064  ORF Transcript_23153/g.53064 Transcript_23153/m.53064 type:complete len:206 (-) Transcript_23153:370-987(-)
MAKAPHFEGAEVDGSGHHNAPGGAEGCLRRLVPTAACGGGLRRHLPAEKEGPHLSQGQVHCRGLCHLLQDHTLQARGQAGHRLRQAVGERGSGHHSGSAERRERSAATVQGEHRTCSDTRGSAHQDHSQQPGYGADERRPLALRGKHPHTVRSWCCRREAVAGSPPPPEPQAEFHWQHAVAHLRRLQFDARLRSVRVPAKRICSS